GAVVIVCPRGGGGAKRTYDYFKAKGVAEARLTILAGGQKDWPY
ncbi:MAG: rhodanese-like domain-containing protein, partial [Phycisphaerae bacterium]|nr:rhodanese-like domain-containing protein [Phycisphaerae bacterium]NIX29968.1 rhodanese-like domain-containing protein [Phycisphaerae bacterium]